MKTLQTASSGTHTFDWQPAMVRKEPDKVASGVSQTAVGAEIKEGKLTKVSDSEGLSQGHNEEPDHADQSGASDEGRAKTSTVGKVRGDEGVDGSSGVGRRGQQQRLLSTVTASLQNHGQELIGMTIS